jgi:methionyl-tRNA formyltransferase
VRLGWIGAHREGLPALQALLERDVPIEAVITLRPEVATKRSGGGDYRGLCERFGVPLHEVDSINDHTAVALLRRLDLDLVFVIGWTQILRPEVLKQARVGMIGAHASLLPADRGRAPINWALIRGASTTGNTLFWLNENVDAGAIIDQVSIPISAYDTCDTLYRRVAAANRDMILRVLPQLMAGEHPGRAQDLPPTPPLPGRRPEDGLVDWNRPSIDVYNFVRALTRPYPGAFSYHGSERFTIWQCGLFPAATLVQALPGEVMGPVLSPNRRACGQVVACGDGGAVVLLEIEDSAGNVIRGRDLSELRWTGHRLTQRPLARQRGAAAG